MFEFLRAHFHEEFLNSRNNKMCKQTIEGNGNFHERKFE